MGEEVAEAPCVQEWQLDLYRKRKKNPQPCPRPALTLHPDNQIAWSYLQLQLGDVTRGGAEGLLMDAVRSPEERVRIRIRAAAVLSDPEVSELLFPRRKDEDATEGSEPPGGREDP